MNTHVWNGVGIIALVLLIGILIFPEELVYVTEVGVFKKEIKSTTVLFVGDIMLDRSVREVGEREGYGFIFDKVSERLKIYDAVVGNLEGPVTSHASVSLGTTSVDEPGHMQFTFSSKIPQVLTENNFTLMTLGNNHILDFGRDGFEQTKKYLDQAGVLWVGNPYGGEENVHYVVQNDISFAYISFNQFLGRDLEEIVAFIQEASQKADVVVVLAHWGEEYTPEPATYVIPWARSFVDAGADVVIGGHPHVIEPSEDYGGGRIYYSLGNFVFDQYWEPSVRCGLGVEMTVKKDESDTVITFEEIKFGLDRSRQTVLGCS